MGPARGMGLKTRGKRMEQTESKLTESELSNFIGTERYHKLSAFGSVIFTDGMAHVAERAGAYWLMQEISVHVGRLAQQHPDERMFFGELTLHADRSATLTFTDGDKGEGPVTYLTQKIPFTDFPLERFRWYVQYGSISQTQVAWVAMLPAEY
jgi:hypothetical protein